MQQILNGLGCVLFAAPALVTTSQQVTPLPKAQKEIFWGSPEDAKPRVLGGVTKKQYNRHYVTSNEGHLDLFYPTLKNLGGGYAGVGTDQAYLFIGWQRPTLAWLTDYDPVVGSVHHI